MIHSEVFQIRNYETGKDGFLTLFSLANYLQHAADRHAVQLGVGMPALAQRGLSWVLHRMKIDVQRWPAWAEEVTLETHPSGIERVYVYRDFSMFDQNRNLLMTATSTWLVFDSIQRSLSTPDSGFMTIFAPYARVDFLPRATGKPVAFPSGQVVQCIVQARQNEIDANEHVNNSVFFQWMLEALSADFLQQNHCIQFEILFKKECRRDDVITSCCLLAEEGKVYHRLINSEEKEVAWGESRWRKA